MFLKFIDTCLKCNKLDPCHYFSSPGLSWDVMLKMTGVKLEKISNINMYLFSEKGLRGGISYIAKRYAEANNKYTEKMYSMKSIDGKESKGVNIATEFKEFNDNLFNKKVLRHKIKRIQSKKT